MDILQIQPSYSSVNDITLEELKKRATKIHYFGLGFIQIKLGETERIHFYTSSLQPIVEKEEVHDHRYGFHSFVLHGTYHQEFFEIVDGNTHTLGEETCMDPNIKERTVINKNLETRSCSIRKISDIWLSKGSHYYVQADTFHRVETTEAITFLVREKPYKNFARIVKVKDAPSICPFSKQIDEEELWKTVEDLLKKAKGE